MLGQSELQALNDSTKAEHEGQPKRLHCCVKTLRATLWIASECVLHILVCSLECGCFGSVISEDHSRLECRLRSMHICCFATFYQATGRQSCSPVLLCNNVMHAKHFKNDGEWCLCDMLSVQDLAKGLLRCQVAHPPIVTSLLASTT